MRRSIVSVAVDKVRRVACTVIKLFSNGFVFSLIEV